MRNLLSVICLILCFVLISACGNDTLPFSSATPAQTAAVSTKTSEPTAPAETPAPTENTHVSFSEALSDAEKETVKKIAFAWYEENWKEDTVTEIMIDDDDSPMYESLPYTSAKREAHPGDAIAVRVTMAKYPPRHAILIKQEDDWTFVTEGEIN